MTAQPPIPPFSNSLKRGGQSDSAFSRRAIPDLVTPARGLSAMQSGQAVRVSDNPRRQLLLSVFTEMSNAIASGDRMSVNDPIFQDPARFLPTDQPQVGEDDHTTEPTGFSPVPPRDLGTGGAKTLTRSDLTSISSSNGRTGFLLPEAAQSFTAMKAAAARDGVTLNFSGAWRSWELQNRAWQNFKATGKNLAGNKVPNIAHPDNSFHPQGLAIDFSLAPGVHEWLVANGTQFGWKPIRSEPWHWEYRPTDTGTVPPANRSTSSEIPAPVTTSTTSTDRTIENPKQVPL